MAGQSRRRLRWVLIPALLCSCVWYEYVASTHVLGKIVITGAPTIPPGTTVELQEFRSVSSTAAVDSSGGFQFPALVTGEYQLTVNAPATQVLKTTVNVAEGGVRVLPLVTVTGLGTVTGRVVAGGIPVPGASVMILNPPSGGSSVRPGFTGSNGTFTLENIPAGRSSIQVTFNPELGAGNGGSTASQTVQVTVPYNATATVPDIDLGESVVALLRESPQLLAENARDALIALGPGTLYFSFDDSSASVLATSLAGARDITFASNIGLPDALAADDLQVYAAVSTSVSCNASGGVWAIPGGGTPVHLAGGSPSAIAVYGENVYWVNSDYCSTESGDFPDIETAPRHGGGAPATLVSGISGPFSLAVDDSGLYWVSDTGSEQWVMRAPLAGGTPTTLWSADLGSSIALDEDHVYWTAGNALFAAQKEGGSVKTLVDSAQAPRFPRTNAQGLYWLQADLSEDDNLMYLVPGGEPVTLRSQISPSTALAVNRTTAVVVTNAGDIFAFSLPWKHPSSR
jgi:hypothetical protein